MTNLAPVYDVQGSTEAHEVDVPTFTPHAEQEPYYSRYLTLVSVLSNAFHRTIKPHRLNATEYRILVRLVTHKGCLKLSELAIMLSLSHGTIVLAYSQLVQAGAVRGEADLSAPKDPCLSITSRGVAYVREIRELVAPIFYHVWNEIPLHLHAYTRACTLCVSEVYDLFPEEHLSRPTDVAIFEETFLTATIVSQICGRENTSSLGYRILSGLKNEPEGMKPGVLAKELQVKPNSITAAGKQLQALSLIRQTSSMSDRRSSILEITSDGWNMQSRIDVELSKFLMTGLLPHMAQEDVKKHQMIAETVLGSGVPVVFG